MTVLSLLAPIRPPRPVYRSFTSTMPGMDADLGGDLTDARDQGGVVRVTAPDHGVDGFAARVKVVDEALRDRRLRVRD